MRDMGLRIAFGHDGATCPQLRPDRLEAITTRGIVTVNVDFCACVDATSDEEQIKAHGWQVMRSNFVLAIPLAVVWTLLGL